MIDEMTKQPLTVSTDSKAGPYIMLTVQQVDEVRPLLDANNITYWVDETAVSLDGGPEFTYINLKRDTNAELVQRILDNAS